MSVLPDPPGPPDAPPADPEGWLARAWRLLVGDDVFISYSRWDASDYALALAGALTKAGLSCFLDQWGTDADESLPEGLKAALRGSGVLVVIASPQAAGSPYVAEEIEIFRGLRRPILPVSIGNAGLDAAWWTQVRGLAVTVDKGEHLLAGTPGEQVIERITAAVGFRSRRRRLRRGLFGTAVLLACAAVAVATTSAAAARQASRARALALVNEAAGLVQSDPAGALRAALRATSEDAGVRPQQLLADVLLRYPRLAGAFRAGVEAGIDRVAFSPDGTLLATADARGRLRFWDARSMRELPLPASVDAPAILFGVFAFTPDGRWLVAGGKGEMTVWRVADRTPASTLEVDVLVSGMAIRRDGLIAAAVSLGPVLLLRVDDRGQLRVAGTLDTGNAWQALELAFQPGTSLLAAGTTDRVVLVDVDRKSVLREIPAKGQVWHPAFSPDGRVLAFVDDRDQVTEWNVERGEALPALAADRPEALPAGRRMAYGADGTLLTTQGGTVRAWSPDSTGARSFLRDTVGSWPAGIASISPSPDGRLVAAGSEDGMVTLWRVNGPGWLRRDLHPVLHAPIATDSAGRRFLVEWPGDGIGIWDAQTGDSAWLSDHPGRATLSADGTMAALAWRDTLLVYSLGPTGATAAPPLVTDIEIPWGVRAFPDGRHVAVWDGGGVSVWDTRARRRFARIGGASRVLAVSSDGELMAVTGSRDNRLHLFHELREVSGDPGRGSAVLAAAFARGGRELVSYHENGVIVRWRLRGLRRGTAVVDTVVQAGYVAAGAGWVPGPEASFSADGRLLAVKLRDRPALVWDVARGEPLLASTEGYASNGSVALSADGSQLVLDLHDEFRPYALDLSTGARIRAACSILGLPADSLLADPVDRVCADVARAGGRGP